MQKILLLKWSQCFMSKGDCVKHCTATDFWLSEAVVYSLLWPLLSQNTFITELIPSNG